jgi:hypothetical protein
MATSNNGQKQSKKFAEIGATGLKQFSGYVYEEFLPELKGRRGTRVYKQMANNDPIVGAILFAIEMLLRNVEWRTEPASADPEDLKVADFVESCRHDMSHSWADFTAERSSQYTYGWAYHEIVYKRRLGPYKADGSKRSKYSDGLIGWRKLPIRSQDSLLHWKFSDDNGIEGMKQQTDTGRISFIPIDKAVLFRTTSTKNNPEGRSVIRNAYRPWYFKSKIETYEAIGIERDLAGLPTVWVDHELITAAAEGDTDAAAAMEEYKALGRNIRNDEQACIVMPLAYDEKGNKLYDIELLSSGGQKSFDTNTIISRYDTRIAQTVLADFIMLGAGKTGSFALSSDKTEMFATALGAWLKSDADTMNRFLIPRLLEVNKIDPGRCPKFVPGDIEKKDIEKMINAINDSVLSGALILDEPVQDVVREALDIPKAD